MHTHDHARSRSDLHPRALAARPYDQGLHDLGNGVFAYLQPNGSWGWSNAGLIVDGEEALLVDTLFDLHLTRRMLAEMRRADRRAEHIGVVVNTHANPDHTNGNSLLPEAEVIASARTAEEMKQENPAVLAGLMRQARSGFDPVSRYLVHCFGAFDFEGVPPSVPDRSFTGRLSINVGARQLELIELGAAHTGGDIVIYSPADRVVYAGDLLFVGGHPVMWAGPIENWVAACDRLLGLDVDYVVPGHGPITDKRGIRAVRDYLALVQERATAAFRADASRQDAARALEAELKEAGYAEWCDGERITATVAGIYRHLQGASAPLNVGALFAEMAAFRNG
jgi:glyoxylase-like metal-dependent hydrolase (beta-lactamase superfamily II)